MSPSPIIAVFDSNALVCITTKDSPKHREYLDKAQEAYHEKVKRLKEPLSDFNLLLLNLGQDVTKRHCGDLQSYATSDDASEEHASAYQANGIDGVRAAMKFTCEWDYYWHHREYLFHESAAEDHPVSDEDFLKRMSMGQDRFRFQEMPLN